MLACRKLRVAAEDEGNRFFWNIGTYHIHPNTRQAVFPVNLPKQWKVPYNHPQSETCSV